MEILRGFRRALMGSVKTKQKRRVKRGDCSEQHVADCTPADSSPLETWFQMVKQHSTALVQQLVDEGQIDVNTRDQDGWSALHISVWNGFADIVVLLLEGNADINLPGVGGSTPLSLAAQKGHSNIVGLLIAAGCDVRRTASIGFDSHDVTALHLAAQNGHCAIVKQLIDAGAIVNAPMASGNMRGVTPLHLAVQAEHLAVMDVLLAAGSDVHSSTQSNADTSC